MHVGRQEDGLKLSLAAVHLSRSTRSLLTVLHVALLTRPPCEAVDLFLRLLRGEGGADPGTGSAEGSRGRVRIVRMRDEYGDESLSSVSDDLARIISGCKVAKEIPLLQQPSSHTSSGAGRGGEKGASACDEAIDRLLRQWVEEFVSERMWRYVLDQPTADSDTLLGDNDGAGRDPMEDCPQQQAERHHDLSEDFADVNEREVCLDGNNGASSTAPSFLAVLCELCQVFFKLHVRMVSSSAISPAGGRIDRQDNDTMKNIAAIDTATKAASGDVSYVGLDDEGRQARDGAWEGAEEGKADEDEDRMVEAEEEEDDQRSGSQERLAGKSRSRSISRESEVRSALDMQALHTKAQDEDEEGGVGVGGTVMSADPNCCYELLGGEEGGVGVAHVCELLLGLMRHFLRVYGEVKSGVSDDVDISPLGCAEDVFWLGDVAWNMVSVCP